jgi:hypothetical protein
MCAGRAAFEFGMRQVIGILGEKPVLESCLYAVKRLG